MPTDSDTIAQLKEARASKPGALTYTERVLVDYVWELASRVVELSADRDRLRGALEEAIRAIDRSGVTLSGHIGRDDLERWRALTPHRRTITAGFTAGGEAMRDYMLDPPEERPEPEDKWEKSIRQGEMERQEKNETTNQPD